MTTPNRHPGREENGEERNHSPLQTSGITDVTRENTDGPDIRIGKGRESTMTEVYECIAQRVTTPGDSAPDLASGQIPSVETNDINENGFQLLKTGNIKAFNQLRKSHPDWFPDFSRLDLSKLSLSGVNLSGAVLIGVILTNGQKIENTNFSGANLSHAELRSWSTKGCNFSGANMTKAKTDDGTCFYSANLDGADMSRIWYPPMTLPMFTRNNIRGTKLTKQLFEHIKVLSSQTQGTPIIVSAAEIAELEKAESKATSSQQRPATSPKATVSTNSATSSSSTAQPITAKTEPLAKTAPERKAPAGRAPKRTPKLKGPKPPSEEAEAPFDYGKLTVISTLPDILGLGYTDTLSSDKETALKMAKDKAIKEHERSRFKGEELKQVIDNTILRYQRNQLIALGLYTDPLQLKYPDYWDHERKKFEIDMTFHHLCRIMKFRGELDKFDHYREIYDQAVKALAKAEAEKKKSKSSERPKADWLTDEAISKLEASRGMYKKESEESYRDKEV